MMKRLGVYVFFMTIFLASFASAAYYGYGIGSGLGYGMQQLVDLVEEISEPVAYALFGSNDYMFERILFLAVIISIVYVILKSDNVPVFKGAPKSIVWIITIAIGLLATRFMVESELIRSMILPYTILGVVLTSALPLVIYYFFVESFKSSTARKLLWIFFIVVFLGIWGSRYEELGELSWIYFLTGLIAFFLLLFDGTIRRAMQKQQLEQMGYNRRQEYIADIHEQLDKLQERNTKGIITDDYYNEQKKRLEKQLKSYSKG